MARMDFIERLVHEHHAGLRAYIRALGILPDSVDDLCQESFLVAFRRFDEFDAERDAGNWLRGIARNLAANERRKQGRKSRLMASGLTNFFLQQADEVLAEPAEDWQELLHSCLEELPDSGRELLMQRYGAGDLAESMAAKWQMRADALRQKLFRLRQLMKRCMERKSGVKWK